MSTKEYETNCGLAVYSLTPQEDPDQLETFIDLPFELRKGDEYWCAPFKQSVKEELLGRTAFSKELKLNLLLCFRNGKAVGRLTAIVHPLLKDKKSQSTVGQIGYFESIDDQSVANALFKVAADWFESLAISTVWGPINGGAHTDYRFMTEGFDEKPFLFEARNPPYYPDLFRSAGFTGLYEWFSVEGDNLSNIQRDFDEFMLQKSLVDSSGISCEFPDLQNTAAVAHRLYSIFNRCWEGHIAFVPLSFEAFVESVGKLLGIVETGDLCIAKNHDGEELGFCFQYPNLWKTFKGMQGDAQNLSSLMEPQEADFEKVEKVIYAYAVDPDWRDKSVAAPLFKHVFLNQNNGLYSTDDFLIAHVLRGLRQFKKFGKVNRRYALYRCDTSVLQRC